MRGYMVESSVWVNQTWLHSDCVSWHFSVGRTTPGVDIDLGLSYDLLVLVQNQRYVYV